MEKINEDLYRDDPTPMELVAVIRKLEAAIRKFGREEYTEWMNYAKVTYFNTPAAQTWRDLRRDQLDRAVDEITEFVEELQIPVNESVVNEKKSGVGNLVSNVRRLSDSEISDELHNIWVAIHELQKQVESWAYRK